MPPSSHDDRVARAFDRASRYDEAASVQRIVAQSLADRIASRPLSPTPAILEIGCGTGFLTAALAPQIGEATWTVTDVAPAMLDRARARSVVEGDYRLLDGTDPGSCLDAGSRFDLICSSLAFQWFEDLSRAIACNVALLRPGGLLAFATMAEGSFAEWREAGGVGTPEYPGTQAIAAMAPEGVTSVVEEASWAWTPGDARGFLHSLKAIGAGVPAAGSVPLSPAALRAAMARFNAGGAVATYHIAFAFFRRAN